jgi:putative hemolysin
MKHTIKLFSLILAVAMLLSACAPAATPTVAPQAATKVPAQPTATTAAPRPTSTAKSSVAIPNPAAKYCADQGFKCETRTTADGSQYGVCKFPDGYECEEWAYYRGECEQGQYTVAPTPTLTPASTTTD